MGDLVSRKRAKKRRKRNARTSWRDIHRRMPEMALTAYVDPRNTSRECPKCGFIVEIERSRSLSTLDAI
ncbi:MAG: hypothetical protein RQ885_06215 [Desulfurococcales archaeon]|jgi:putative transposase|nr:hypothetical protein [Desulfurococcales archaeon]